MEGNLRLKIDWASLTGAVSEAAAITSHFQQNSHLQLISMLIQLLNFS